MEIDAAPPRGETGPPPAPVLAAAELFIAAAILTLTLAGYIAFTATPWLLAAATVFLWWRGSGWSRLGLTRAARPTRALTVGIAAGLGYQFVGTYLIEP